MQCSVFIATSVDGYIATKQGGIEWLETAGDKSVDLGERADMGFNNFIHSVDCMVMGRGCMDTIASFNLTDEQWPYGELPIYVLTKSKTEVPESLIGRVTLFAGEIDELMDLLNEKGLKHVYVDGGALITSFLNEQLINNMIITQAPILLGSGIPLFGYIKQPLTLSHVKAEVFANGFVQNKYQVSYP